MIVPGDQWPIFLYAGSEYDPEDPWKGLFRSTLLISVSLFYIPFRSLLTFFALRLINMFLLPQVRLRKALELRDRVTREFMA